MATRGNDAIPTWSGFNYQGKVMLLRVLEHINFINSLSENLEDYKVNIEQYEDFVILKNNEVVELYQVKAVLSKNKCKDYLAALDKLEQHRKDLKAPFAQCFLATANEIVDGDNDNTRNKDTRLYKYDGQFISVTKVSEYIKKELNKYINAHKLDLSKNEIIYLELCEYIDQIVAKMHQVGYKKREYDIPYIDFVNVIKQSITLSESRESSRLKEKVYKYITDSILNALDTVCNEKCKNNSNYCTKKCAAKEAYVKILELPEIYKYFRIINPSKIGQWEELDYVSNAARDDFKRYIFSLFYKINDTECVVSHNNAVKVNSANKNTNLKNKMIIPSFTKIDSSNGVQITLNNILDNNEIIDYLYGNVIVIDTTMPLLGRSIEESIITNEFNRIKDERNITELHGDIELISFLTIAKEFGFEC